jgi:addiction module RelB/DinJ family antitoxin
MACVAQVGPAAYLHSVAVFNYTLTRRCGQRTVYLHPMSLITRSATIQVRVMPLVKRASEEVLSRIGLNMSEAVELFLRRVIVDERIPFDLIALGTAQIGISAEGSPTGERAQLGKEVGLETRSSRSASKTRAAKKEFKKFLGTPMSGNNRGQKVRKNIA